MELGGEGRGGGGRDVCPLPRIVQATMFVGSEVVASSISSAPSLYLSAMQCSIPWSSRLGEGEGEEVRREGGREGEGEGEGEEVRRREGGREGVKTYAGIIF